MRLSRLKTNKLFFGEYPYKISTRVLGGNLIRIKGIEHLKKFGISPLHYKLYQREIDQDKLLKFVNIFEQFTDYHIKMRTEQDTVNLFVKEKLLYEKLQQEFAEFIVFVSEPSNDQELEILAKNKKYILCDELPKGKFKFRVTIRSRMPATIRENFASWLIKYTNEDIYLTPLNLEALKTGKRWWKDYPIYVSNDKMLTLLALASGGYLRKTEEFVLRSSINNNI